MRILVIEDDFLLSDGLKQILEGEGFIVDTVHNGIDGCDYIDTLIYDLVLLDLNLPEMDGFSVLNHISIHSISTPVIIISARNEIDDKLRGFYSGAIDYVTKPFDARELVARIRLRLNISSIQNKNYTLGNTRLCLENYSILNGDKSISLTKKEFSILEQLLLHKNTIVLRDAIITRVWGIEEQVDYRTLDVYMSMLRKKLRYINSDIEICTKRSVGYLIRERTSSDKATTN